MTLEKLDLVRRNTEEIVTLEELKELKPEVSEKLDKIIDLIKKLKEGKGMAITL